MASITINLSDAGLAKLRELAREAKVAPEELVRASVEEWLNRPEDAFTRAAGYVLQKNAALYRRLA
jgi:hypothetical protein